jgi:anthranilate phosphoribosyltransferase
MSDAVGTIMDGCATQAQVSGLLVALCVRGENVDELVGAALALRQRARQVSHHRQPLMDVCGTGGDAVGSFNISTAVAFVVAGAGVAVAKHGNRAMSSRCGSADVLEALGVHLQGASNVAEWLLEQHGIAFLFAQIHHPAMRAVAAVRKELGVHTVFNLVGPLANPALASHQLIGVANVRALPAVAGALARLGSRRAAVVCAEDGMDEVSLSSATRVTEWTGETIKEYTLDPRSFGMRPYDKLGVRGSTPSENAAIIRNVLMGSKGPARDIVVVNAALALQIAGAAPNLHDGVRLAQRSVDTGAAYRKLQALVEASQ